VVTALRGLPPGWMPFDPVAAGRVDLDFELHCAAANHLRFLAVTVQMDLTGRIARHSQTDQIVLVNAQHALLGWQGCVDDGQIEVLMPSFASSGHRLRKQA